MTANRARMARTRAGLSLGQAARITGIDITVISRIELELKEPIDPAIVAKMCDVYAVNPAWLTGATPQHDYDALAKMKGADDLCEHDKDIVAEFIAAMQKRS
jgi:transcriptional regulator with XRE-family HTH domain